jgi:diaminopimelate epimerase
LSVLRLGNPHAIVNITDLPNAVHLSAILVDVLGQHIAAHDHFPEGVNVGFVHVIDRTHIQLRTYERGSGETNACGSNACAAVAVGISNGWLDTCVTVELRYGELTIEWPSVNHAIVMTGPATQVFRGEVVL